MGLGRGGAVVIPDQGSAETRTGMVEVCALVRGPMNHGKPAGRRPPLRARPPEFDCPERRVPCEAVRPEHCGHPRPGACIALMTEIPVGGDWWRRRSSDSVPYARAADALSCRKG